ncbi:MAG: M24 family metallopeptidase, partial [Nitrospira sp.]|nr:M24 family metallopeptidase [Nitrospira sp.]
MKKQVALLIIASSEADSNIYYSTKFLAPDPFIFIQAGDEKIIIMSDLEYDRAKIQAKVDTVLSYSVYEEAAKKNGITEPAITDVLHMFFTERGIRDIVVPEYFGIKHTLLLQEKNYSIEVKSNPFFEERAVKNNDEIGYLTEVLHHSERAVDKAIRFIKNSDVRNGFLYSEGRQVTSEDVKRIMAVYLLENGIIAQHTIVSCGADTAIPHSEGSGYLKADVPIIIDLFPRSMTTLYHADITRTVVKGNASSEIKDMYDAVLQSHKVAMSMIKNGVNGQDIHTAILKLFKDLGFESGEIDGKMQGFFHGTGHGVGLDIHESPRISKRKDQLHTGNVVTV